MPPIAEFELRVLLTVRRLGEEAYAVAVHEDLERRSRRRTSQGAVYITLDRLERKGLLGSRMGDPTPERGGRAKRFYRLTRAGLNAVRDEVRLMQRLWDGLDVVSNEQS